jgi:hypothetical protein
LSDKRAGLGDIRGACPQCGSDGYVNEIECKACGFDQASADERSVVLVPMKDDRRDVMNGIGLGCSVLAMIWFFVETLVFIYASTDPKTWSYYGPLVSVSVPMALVTGLYLLLQRKPSNFSKGVGYSLLISLVIFLIGGIALHATDNKPPANGAQSEGF